LSEIGQFGHPNRTLEQAAAARRAVNVGIFTNAAWEFPPFIKGIFSGALKNKDNFHLARSLH
jgi:hypothetical protein